MPTSYLSPHKPGLVEQLMRMIAPEQANANMETMDLGKLASGGDQYAASTPQVQESVRMAGKPQAGAGNLVDDLVELFSGGGGNFWSTNAQRAASFGPVKTVKVPRSVFEQGQKEAALSGQPTKWDTVLPNDWVKRAVDAPQIKPTVYEAADESEQGVEALLKALGVKRF